MLIVTKVKEITEARASVGLLLATAVGPHMHVNYLPLKYVTQSRRNISVPFSVIHNHQTEHQKEIGSNLVKKETSSYEKFYSDEMMINPG